MRKKDTYRTRVMSLVVSTSQLRQAALNYAEAKSHYTFECLASAALDFAAKARTLSGRNG